MDHDWYLLSDGNWVWGERIRRTLDARMVEILVPPNEEIFHYFAGQFFIRPTVVQSPKKAMLKSAMVSDGSQGVELDGVVVSYTVDGETGTISAPTGHTLTFVPNGGRCSVTAREVYEGQLYPSLPTPHRPGYTFDGWFTAAEGGTQVLGDTPFTANTDQTLYAHWTRIILLQGSCGDNLTFILYGDGEMIVEGYGEMTSHPWTDNYAKYVSRLTLPEGLTGICEYAFFGCEWLQELNLSDQVTHIDSQAFRDCISLTVLTLPEGLTTLHGWAFLACTGLESVYIPASLINDTYTESNPFEGCDALKAVTWGQGITKIPSGLLHSTGLETVTIPISVTEIGNNAFGHCESLTDIFYAGAEVKWKAITIGEAAIPAGVIIHFTYAPGDINKDSFIDITDLVSLVRHMSKLETITDDEGLKLADVDGVCSVSAADLTALARLLLAQGSAS